MKFLPVVRLAAGICVIWTESKGRQRNRPYQMVSQIEVSDELCTQIGAPCPERGKEYPQNITAIKNN